MDIDFLRNSTEDSRRIKTIDTTRMLLCYY